MKRVWACVLLTAVCLAVGGLSSLAQGASLREWYPLLEKSPLTPPGVVFAVVWSLLYLCIGISGGLVVTSDSASRHRIMRLWTAQLAFNFGWSLLFFAFRNPLLGLIDLVVLDLLVAIYLWRCFRHRMRAAGWLFVPYLAWILFATWLNLHILVANGTGF